MDLIEYEKLVKSENAARRYLLSFCWARGERRCPRCRSGKVYTLADERFRCGACRYTFHDFSGRFANCGNLTCRDWLRLIKLFELELTVHRMASQLRLAYNTVYKAVTVLRFAILAQALDAHQFLEGDMARGLGYDGGRITFTREGDRLPTIPVFGVIEKDGWVFVDLLPSMEALTLFHFNVNFKLRLVNLGSILYTDRYQHYDTLIFRGDDRLPYNAIQHHDRGVYVDSLRSSFWSFALPRLKRYNGVSPHRFPLYLKELEFRYNFRSADVFPMLCQYLCAPLPRTSPE